MSLARGIQSALFYYLSCAPCTGYAFQRRRRKQARRDRAEKRALTLDQPDMYRQPDISSTNPHWNEEIALGPGPPTRGKNKKGPRKTATNGTQSSTGSYTNSDAGAAIRYATSPTASESTLNDEYWNRRQQREEEDAWASETLSSRGGPARQPSSAGSSAGLVVLGRPSTGRSASDSYYHPRAPPVNDYHPPVVSALSPNVGDNHWMLRPPPSAKVMSGKSKSIRSRSGSTTSSRPDTSLQREMSHRQIEERLRRGETPDRPSVSGGNSFTTMTNEKYTKARKASTSSVTLNKASLDRPSIAEDSDTSEGSINGRHDSGNPLVLISGNAGAGSTTKVSQTTRTSPSAIHSGDSDLERPTPPVRASTDLKKSVRYKENISEIVRPKTVSKPAPLIVRDSSLNLLQELVSPGALLNSQFVKSPTLEARIKLPPINSIEELQLRSLSPWFPSDDFMAASSDSESSRDLRSRWSMDI
ncbi:uncharacterized protein IWZ02DRAFT_372382 [Phyllosticta citriasiana]|uniref:uncharacterized protein n=1 Tax=Phyllosticta citriasiana TaxID=595635 RepID=UPI0030FD2A09